MNVYQKLAKARLLLKQAGMKQSGNNKFAGYTYFELGDFLPDITKIENEVGLLSCISFGVDTATLTMFNTDEGKDNEYIVFNSPMSTAQLKGCHEVQNLGAVQTYIRRYLYNTAYEIVECDALDAGEKKEGNKPENKTTKAQNKQSGQVEQAKATAAQKPVSEPVTVKKLTLTELVQLGCKEAAKSAAWLCKQYGVSDLTELSDEDTEEARAFVKSRAEKERQKAMAEADGEIPFPMEG